MDYTLMPGDHWAVFYRAYRDWLNNGECLCSEDETWLFRVLRTIREQLPLFHTMRNDNVEAQSIVCSCWHEIQREKCIQEIWNAPCAKT